MSHWNTRVIRKYDQKTDTTIFEMHEVHYDDNNRIIAWTESSVGPFGETLAELKEDIKHFLEAVQKPILQENCHEAGEILVEVKESER